MYRDPRDEMIERLRAENAALREELACETPEPTFPEPPPPEPGPEYRTICPHCGKSFRYRMEQTFKRWRDLGVGPRVQCPDCGNLAWHSGFNRISP